MTDTLQSTDHTRASRPETIFNPRSVAVLGATDNPAKLISYRPVEYLRRFGYEGAVLPVNPKYTKVQGLDCAPSLQSLDEPPDAVVVSLPREAAVEAVRQAAEMGVGTAIVYSSGFSEVIDGQNLQAELRSIGRTGIEIVGPNCQGLANVHTGYFPCFSTAFAAGPPQAGSTAVVSQSGAVAAMLYNRWKAVGGGLSYWASTGNEAHRDVTDLTEVLLHDDQVDLVLVYLESVKDPAAFDRLDHLASLAGKHIVVYRSTLSSVSWAASRFHTGSGDEPGLEQELRAGAHLHVARSLDEVIALGQYLRSGQRLRGRRLAVLSNSGGLGVMTADALSGADMSLPALSADSSTALERLLPAFASARNPVDVTAQLLNDPHLFAKALPPLLDDPAIDGLVVALGAVGDGYDLAAVRDDMLAATGRTDKLLAICQVGASIDGLGAHFGSAGLMVFDSAVSLATALQTFIDPVEVAPFDGPAHPRLGDLAVGARYRSEPVTATAQAMDAYAAVVPHVGEPNVHESTEAARTAGHPERLISGLHVLSYVTLLGERIGMWAHASVMAGFDHVRFVRPAYEGDNLRLTLTVDRIKPVGTAGDRALVTFAFTISAAADGQTHTAAQGHVTYLFHDGM